MLDQETLRPVILAMTFYMTMSVLVPKLAKKSTGIKLIDDIVAFLIAQEGNVTSGTILIGLGVFFANYVDQEFF
jgi:formate/nitrite transporter FocA (FNT family)